MPRGRKLDGQKGLNKQLIHQRAFRKRRTERLAELEDRKHQLEEENARLRSNQIQPDVDAIDNTKVAVPCPTCLIYDTQKDELNEAAQQVFTVYSDLLQCTENLKKAFNGDHLTVVDEEELDSPQFEFKDMSLLSYQVPSTVHHISARQSQDHFKMEPSIEIFNQQSENILDGLLESMNGIPTHYPPHSDGNNCCLGIPGCNTVDHCPFPISNSSSRTE